MYVLTIDGEEVKWTPKNSRKENCSALHGAAREIIRAEFLTQPVLEEVSIPIERNKVLFLDFYLPINRLAVEVDGQQHIKFTPHFHKNYKNFVFAKTNDRLKSQFCEINNIRLIRLPANEQHNWREILLS